MEDLTKELKECADRNMAIATSIRTEEPEKSFFYYKMAELMHKAAKELKRNNSREMEIEGGGSTWWYVCPECHSALESKDHFCSECGQAVKE